MKGRGVYVSVELEARDDDQTAKAEQRNLLLLLGPGPPAKIILLLFSHQPTKFDRLNFSANRQSADYSHSNSSY